MIKFKDIDLCKSFKNDHNGHECTFIKCHKENIDACHPVNSLCINGHYKGLLYYINHDTDCFIE